MRWCYTFAVSDDLQHLSCVSEACSGATNPHDAIQRELQRIPTKVACYCSFQDGWDATHEKYVDLMSEPEIGEFRGKFMMLDREGGVAFEPTMPWVDLMNWIEREHMNRLRPDLLDNDLQGYAVQLFAIGLRMMGQFCLSTECHGLIVASKLGPSQDDTEFQKRR